MKDTIVFKGKVFDVLQTPDGYDIVDMPKGAVGVIALSGDIGRVNESILLVEQYRPAVKRKTLEIPAGAINNGEKPVNAAIREFKEETGYTLKNTKLLHEYYPALGISNFQMRIFTGNFDENEIPKQNLDDDEDINVIKMDVLDFISRKHNEAITILTREYLVRDILIDQEGIDVLAAFGKLYRLYYNVDLVDFNKMFKRIGYSMTSAHASYLQFKDSFHDEEFIKILEYFDMLANVYGGYKELRLDLFRPNSSPYNYLASEEFSNIEELKLYMRMKS